MKRFVVATAGHVDHGKTALVRALTGVDTDRLPEEKRRGISIELGYAPLRISNDLEIGFVDVPGHERFVKTMVAGAYGANAFLLVVAANEGIKAQTKEHLEIFSQLGIPPVACAITKSDVVDPVRLKEVEESLRPLVTNTTLLPVSIVTGEGLPELKDLLMRLPELNARNETHQALAFPIDRCFTRPGFGTVVTGTLSSGTLRKGETLLALPAGIEVSVRSLQIFGTSVDQAEPTTRLAINLSGADRGKIRKGMILCRPGDMTPSRRIAVDTVQRISGMRIRAYLGTQEIRGRIASGKTAGAELRLNDPIVAQVGDRLLLRTESPVKTLGIALVTAVIPPRRLPSKKPIVPLPVQPPDPRSEKIIRDLLTAGLEAPSLDDLSRSSGISIADLRRAALADGRLIRIASDRYFASSAMDAPLALLRKHFSTQPTLRFDEWKTATGLSRKQAMMLLEYFDSQMATICRPDRTRIPGPKLLAAKS